MQFKSKYQKYKLLKILLNVILEKDTKKSFRYHILKILKNIKYDIYFIITKLVGGKIIRNKINVIVQHIDYFQVDKLFVWFNSLDDQ